MDSPIESPAGGPKLQERRGFLAKTVALVVWAAASVTPVAAGVVSFLNPLRQKGRSGEAFFSLASLDSLPEDGTPVKFPIVADRTDAWNYYPNEAIGAVYLRRTGNREVAAFQVVCPHNGCTIEFGLFQDETQGKPVKKFYCPCHKASFDLDGQTIGADSPSPRPMDALEVKIDEDGTVRVQFRNFRTGTPEKVEA
jgi:menaquinol-cytochrome c reductase iron-sulfur subunit